MPVKITQTLDTFDRLLLPLLGDGSGAAENTQESVLEELVHYVSGVTSHEAIGAITGASDFTHWCDVLRPLYAGFLRSREIEASGRLLNC